MSKLVRGGKKGASGGIQGDVLPTDYNFFFLNNPATTKISPLPHPAAFPINQNRRTRSPKPSPRRRDRSSIRRVLQFFRLSSHSIRSSKCPLQLQQARPPRRSRSPYPTATSIS